MGIDGIEMWEDGGEGWGMMERDCLMMEKDGG